MTEVVAVEQAIVAPPDRDAVLGPKVKRMMVVSSGLDQRDCGFDDVVRDGSSPWTTARSASRNGPPDEAGPKSVTMREGAPSMLKRLRAMGIGRRRRWR
jgi:hypothetical protein